MERTNFRNVFLFPRHHKLSTIFSYAIIDWHYLFANQNHDNGHDCLVNSILLMKGLYHKLVNNSILTYSGTQLVEIGQLVNDLAVRNNWGSKHLSLPKTTQLLRSNKFLGLILFFNGFCNSLISKRFGIDKNYRFGSIGLGI